MEAEALEEWADEPGADSSAAYWRADVLRHRLLSTDEERALGELAWRGDASARRALVEHNLRWAAKWAGKAMAGRECVGSMTYQDVLQAACIGLMRAAERFDPSKGFRFTTYATWWIRQSIGRTIMEESHMVHRPIWVSTGLARIHRLQAQYETEMGDTGATPPDAWLLAHGAKPNELAVWHNAAPPEMLSLERPAMSEDGDDGSAPLDLLRQLEGEPVEGGEQDVEATDAAATLLALMREHLTAQQFTVLYLRSGAFTHPHTLEEIGRKLRISRERVRQIEGDARRIMRQQLERIARREALG